MVVVSYFCSMLFTIIIMCNKWSLTEKTRLAAFEMKGLRKILRVSWSAKKTNEWVLNKAGVKRELETLPKQGS